MNLGFGFDSLPNRWHGTPYEAFMNLYNIPRRLDSRYAQHSSTDLPILTPLSWSLQLERHERGRVPVQFNLSHRFEMEFYSDGAQARSVVRFLFYALFMGSNEQFTIW
jgi:hypothetical protein